MIGDIVCRKFVKVTYEEMENNYLDNDTFVRIDTDPDMEPGRVVGLMVQGLVAFWHDHFPNDDIYEAFAVMKRETEEGRPARLWEQ